MSVIRLAARDGRPNAHVIRRGIQVCLDELWNEPVELTPSPFSPPLPTAELHHRPVRIYKPTKSTMQSGKAGMNHWRIDFDNLQGSGRWINPLMGWASSSVHSVSLPLSSSLAVSDGGAEANVLCGRLRCGVM